MKMKNRHNINFNFTTIMKRVLFSVILLLAAGFTFAQEKTVKEAKSIANEVNPDLGRTCVVLTGPRTDVNAIAAACQVFVGVSRSALEAMAEEKPVVLSGAQGHTGLFCPELLQKAIDTNFCCRTDPIATEAVLLEATSIFRPKRI